MSEQDQRAAMAAWLRTIGWERGVTKADLLARLVDEDGPRQVVDLYLPEGTYFSPEDVLNVLPAQAWQDAQGMIWRGGEPPVVASVQTGFADSPVAEIEAAAEQRKGSPADGTAEAGAAGDGQAGAAEAGAGALAQVRQVAQVATQAAGQGAQVVGQAAAKVAEQTRERAGAAVQGVSGIGELPDRLRQTAAQARDQVLSVRTSGAETPAPLPGVPAGSASEATRPAVAVALSALVEGLGQAYNRQPGKAAVLAVIGLALSTLSGLNTWLARRALRDPDVRICPERVQPALLGLWGITYAVNLWDAWSQARRAAVDPAVGAAVTPPSWGDLDPAQGTASATTAAAATDEYPTVGTT